MARRTQRNYYRQSRLKQLRAFCAAARTGSMSKAADALNLSQPSVSLQIRALEQDLGTVLFERRGPRIDLSPEGALFYDIASPLVEGLDRLPDEFAARRGAVEGGQIDIAAGESTILYLLPEYVRRFAEMYPSVRVRLHNVTGRDGLAKLRADEVDFAVGSMLEVGDDVRYEPMFEYRATLIAPPDHPLARTGAPQLEDIAHYGLILPPRHLATWGIVDLVFQQHGLDYKVTLEAGGWEVIKRYVEIGLGISIVTSICLRGDEPLFTAPLDEFFPNRTYGVVTRRGRFPSPAARAFMAEMTPARPAHTFLSVAGEARLGTD
ncbi:MAG: LysR family transcriptional regulator [Pseudomonadota bacterium]